MDGKTEVIHDKNHTAFVRCGFCLDAYFSVWYDFGKWCSLTIVTEKISNHRRVAMKYIIEDDGKERRWLKWAITLLSSDKKEALFVSGALINEHIAGIVRNIEHPVIVYVRGKWGALSDEKKKIVLSLLSLGNVGTMAGYPFSFLELQRVYDALEKQEEVDNTYVVLAIRGSIIKMLRATIATIRSEEEKEVVIYRAEKAFGIRVRESEIRKEIKEMDVGVSSLAPPISDGVIKGVFCDAAECLFTIEKEVRRDVVKRLHELEQEKKSVTLWTDGRVADARMILHGKKVRNSTGEEFPIIHKRHYAGRRVQLVIDSLPDMAAFQRKYRIFPDAYIRK